jgi:large subunit ribosomal protein L24
MDLRKYAKFTVKAGAAQLQRPKTLNRTLPFLEVTKHFSKFPRIKSTPKRERLMPVDYFKALSLKQGDLVRILFGKDKGHQGIIKQKLKDNLVTVSGASLQGRKQETPIHVMNIVPLDPVLKRPTRIKTRIMMTGKPVRISKLSRCAMPEPPKLAVKPTTKVRRERKKTTAALSEKIMCLSRIKERIALLTG